MVKIKLSLFKKIYDSLLCPIGQTMADNLSVNFLPNLDVVYNEYQKQKTYFRILCNKINYSYNEEDLLDRHKVCAALCVAISKSSFLSCNAYQKDEVHDLNKYRKYNEQLAVAVSLEVLKSFIVAECENDKSLANPFKQEEFFIFPHPQNANEGYEDTIVRTLYFANTTGQANLHLIAHIFFLIEQYHTLFLKYKQLSF